MLSYPAICQTQSVEFNPDSIAMIIQRVNRHFVNNSWKNVDRNWIRATYYTGLMACWEVNHDSVYFEQAMHWGQKHGWRTGTEWIYPANRLTCVQTYLQLYQEKGNPFMIKRAQEVMDSKINFEEPAEEQGWDYVDALYVGIPAYFMMQQVTGKKAYGRYAHFIFWDVFAQLFDEKEALFFRDKKAMGEKSRNGKKVLWSRGNGWAMASIPRIIEALPDSSDSKNRYVTLLQQMAASIKTCQGKDGFWRSNLADSLDYPQPESSGTAFFTYALSWGINQGILCSQEYLPVVRRAWPALYHSIDEDGAVRWGQGVVRGPGKISENGSGEFVSGSFLLAASELLKMTHKNQPGK